MHNLSIQNQQQKTMSSRDIAELTGKTHSHVLRDIRAMLAELFPSGNPEPDGIDGKAVFLSGIKITKREDNGQIETMSLPKREALILTTGYSIVQRSKVIDRWQELEAAQAAQAAQAPALPSYPEALRALASSLEQIQVQQAQIESQKPAVAFVERYVESSGNKGFREVCKLLKANENNFKIFLIDNQIMYRLGGRLMPMANHLDAKRFEVSAGIGENDHSFTTAKFTPKGINWIAGLWAVHNLQN